MINGEGVAACLAGVLLGLTACAQPAPSYDGAGDRGTASARGSTGRPGVPADAFRATVVRVVDGDTVIARRAGSDPPLRVRLIGIDAPESVTPGVPVQCYGPESSQALRRLLPGGTTLRAAYEAGGERDRYGRQLWAVWLDDGRFLQAVLVARGNVRPHAYWPQRDHAGLLAGLGRLARANGRGLYGACRDEG